jgi:carbamoyl-phosphate synthase small subunit
MNTTYEQRIRLSADLAAHYLLTDGHMYVYSCFRMQDTILVLEDGTVFKGRGFFVEGEVFGEVVFNTSMTGYEEAFTDPSYAGQILIMTYPLIGNYGFHKRYYESDRTQIRGLILKEPYFFSTRGSRFGRYLKETRLPCVAGIDTRALTLKIRNHGTMKGMLVPATTQPRIEQIVEKIQKTPHPDTNNLVAGVSCDKVIVHGNGKTKRVVLIDCGVKRSILRNLQLYATVIQVPYNTDLNAINKQKPDGIVISNGPGNPEHPEVLATTVNTVKQLLDRYSVLGICLGHQILSLALGFKTYKMKFGHRGSNHGVKNLASGKVFITAQNHGYAIEERNVPGVEISWMNVNDHTIEGIRHKRLPISSVQFHPEAGPGPHDTNFLFRDFLNA